MSLVNLFCGFRHILLLGLEESRAVALFGVELHGVGRLKVENLEEWNEVLAGKT